MRYERLRLDPERYRKVIESNSRYNKKHKAKLKKYSQAWEKRNASRRRQQKREYYLTHRDKLMEYSRNWKKKNLKPKKKQTAEHPWCALNRSIRNQTK